MKTFCFTIDDNIRFLKELNATAPQSLFDHPYTAMLYRLHKRFGIKIQLNLFYRLEDFTLADMTDRYRREFFENADWLKLSFHSAEETDKPYLCADYPEVYADCAAVHREILRFASAKCLAATTTVHCCFTTREGVRALADNGICGLLGLFGTRISYGLGEPDAKKLAAGETLCIDGMSYAALDLVINTVKMEDLLSRLSALLTREQPLHLMIHEQYFYPDYRAYQADFEEKLTATFAHMAAQGYENRFFEEMI